MKPEENSEQYTQPDGAEAYKQAFAAFAGADWLSAPQYRQSDEVRLAAGALGEKLGIEALITLEDIEKIGAEVSQRCMLAGVSPADIAKLIAKLTSNVGASKSSLEDIRGEALKDADELATEASDKASEGAEEQAAAWRQIEQLNKEISDSLYDLRTPQERARAAELEKELKRRKEEEERILADPNSTEAQKKAAMQARIDAEGAIIANDKRDVGRIEHDPKTTPAEHRKIDEEVKPAIVKRDEYQKFLDRQSQRYSQKDEEHVAQVADAATGVVTQHPSKVESTNTVASSAESLADFAMNAPEAKPTVATQTASAAPASASVTTVSATESLADFATEPVAAKTTALQVANATADQPTSKGVPKAVASNGQATLVMRG